MSAGDNVQEQIDVMISGMRQLKGYWAALPESNLSDYHINNDTRESVSQIIRSTVVSFDKIPKVTLLFPDVAIGWETLNGTLAKVESVGTENNITTVQYTYYEDYAAKNPLNKVQYKVYPPLFWQRYQAVVYGNSYGYEMGPVQRSLFNGLPVANLVTGLHVNNTVSASLSSTIYVSELEAKLKAQLKAENQQIIITENDGSFVASTYDVSLSENNYDGQQTIQSHSELKLMYDAIVNNYGGWKAVSNVEVIQYNSPDLGLVLVHKSVVRFSNKKWYVFTAWQDSYWSQRVLSITYTNLGVSLGVLIISVILCLLIAIPVVRSLTLIKECFQRIRAMDLDADVIRRVRKKRFLFYEPAELQHGLISMLTTLRNFQKYVPPDVVARLMNMNTEARLGLDHQIGTVFFLDVRDFTSISEHLRPDSLVKLISEAFEGFSSCIHANDGVVDKYIGDCIMAFWLGPDQEQQALQCSMDCIRFLNSKNASWKSRNLPELHIRIGINSGPVLVGNFGSSSRFNYTCLGDNVNLASRIEALNKVYNSTVIAAESTVLRNSDRAAVGSKSPSSASMDAATTKNVMTYAVRRLDRVCVAGKTEDTTIYEVLNFATDLTVQERENLATYENAFDLYQQGRFCEARSLFMEIPGWELDGPTVKKVEQCVQFQEMSDTWDGVVRYSSK